MVPPPQTLSRKRGLNTRKKNLQLSIKIDLIIFLQIQTCVGESLKMSTNFLLTDVNLSQLFVNTTACILAKTRCAATNPITGAYQHEDDLISNKLKSSSINSILVNSDYDIIIMQLPFGHGVVDECAKYRNVEQASWSSAKCIRSSGYY